MTRPRDDYGDLIDLSEFDVDVQLDYLRHQQMTSTRAIERYGVRISQIEVDGLAEQEELICQGRWSA